MTPAVDLVIADKYRLIRPLAEGGMGAIWVAEHLDLEVEVAVKLMTENVASSALGHKRFRREARAAAKLKSPYVTQIHDFGVFDDTPYMVMELLEGEDLQSHIDRKGGLSLSRCAEILMPVCRGLKLAHDAGIVHRDLKPSNVFLSRSGDEEVVKILDFGIAKQTAPEAQIEGTASGVLVGSPRYMSPEQAQGLSVDHRSDIWSLGVMLYEMLTTRLPFDGDNLGQLITAICTREPAKATTLVTTLPEAADELLERALDYDVESRIDSASVFADELAALAGGRPISLIGSTSPPSSERVPVVARSRDDATVASSDEMTNELSGSASVSVGNTVALAQTEPFSVPPKADPTSPGLGMDTQPDAAPRSRMTWVVAAVALAGVGAWFVTRAPEPATGSTDAAPAGVDSAVSPSGAPASSGTASAPPAAPASEAPATSSAPAASTSAAPRTVVAKPKPSTGIGAFGIPVPVKPVPVKPVPVKPKNPPKPKTDDLFGIPQNKSKP